MTDKNGNYSIIFRKLDEIDARELGDIVEILTEAEEIERLRQIVLEVENPEPQTCTTT